MAICTKQSIGTTLAVIVVGYKLLFIENKQEFKQYMKIAITRIIGILIPVIMMFIYLIINNALSEFVNYAILGISTFSNKIEYTALFANDKIQIRILSIIMPISIVLMAVILLITNILKKENENTSKLLTILIYSLSIIIVMYPISDEIHFLLGGTIAIIGGIYTLFLLAKNMYNKITKIDQKKKFKIYKILTDIICIIMFAIILAIGIINIYNYAKAEKNQNIEHYKNIQISEGLAERIEIIDKYIIEKEHEDKKVYILDAEAAVYMIPINNYNKDYDMFLKGNIGKDGEQGQIEKIKNKNENELYMIRKSELRTNWQTPIDVINYIRENLEKVGEISIYEIYK